MHIGTILKESLGYVARQPTGLAQVGPPNPLCPIGYLGPRDSKRILDARASPRNSDSYHFGFRGQNHFSPFLYRFKSSICLLDSTSLVLLFILKTSSLSDLFFKFKSSVTWFYKPKFMFFHFLVIWKISRYFIFRNNHSSNRESHSDDSPE